MPRIRPLSDLSHLCLEDALPNVAVGELSGRAGEHEIGCPLLDRRLRSCHSRSARQRFWATANDAKRATQRGPPEKVAVIPYVSENGLRKRTNLTGFHIAA